MTKLKVADLFSGKGQFSKGLHKTNGFETVLFCENNESCISELREEFSNPVIYKDMKSLKKENFHGVDLICGGVPCQKHSVAGGKQGLSGESRENWEMFIKTFKWSRPKFGIFENSANLGNTGLAEIIETFNKLGYNAEWSIISAYSIGAPSQRRRIYCVLWRRDIPYCDPFRWFRCDIKKEKAASGWWAMRWIKRNPLFKQASKIKPKVLQFNDGPEHEQIIKEVECEIEKIGNSLVPEIPELIGRAIIELA